MCSSCALTRPVSYFLLSIVFMWSYGSMNLTELTLGLLRARVALGGPEIDVSTLLFKDLGIDTCLLLF